MAEPFLGEIILFAGNFAPRGWAFCDGQLLPISSYEAVFSLLGTTYGGDGRTTFGLPELRGRAPIGVGSGPGLTPRSLGARAGQDSVTLTSSQIPPHTHGVDTSAMSATLRGYAGADADSTTPAPANVLSKLQNPVAINAYSNSDAPADLTPIAGVSATVVNAGGSQSHQNYQPYLGVHYIIALQGIYPSRS